MAKYNKLDPGLVTENLKLISLGLKNILRMIEPNDQEAIDNTPQRFTEAFGTIVDLWGFTRPELKDFDFVKSDDLVMVSKVPFYSLCRHHMLPFFGEAHVGYLPNEKVVGLSKIPRIVKYFSNRLQLQENLGREICDELQNSKLEPKGVIVVLKAQHMCMQMRGIQSVGSVTTTSSISGAFKENHDLKKEFYSLM